MRSLLVVVWLTSGLRLLAAAQAPVPSVTVSFGVDTAVVDVGPIVRLVRAYLARPDTSAGSRALWASSNEWDRRHGDLHRQNTYQGFPASIIGVMSAGPGDSLYLVKVLYATADSATRAVTPLALQRLYAVRAPGTEYGWQLSNALPRLTRDWVTRTEGRIRFYYAPGQPENPQRRLRAARFVDSVARLFGVAPPERLDYFVTASPDEYFRALGLDFFPLPSGPGTATGGNALPRESIVLAGDPAQGEAYLHEITHVVLGGFSGGGPILGEGIAVWLGGSKGRSPREMYRLLAEWQRENPAVTLQALLSGEAGWGVRENDARYATGALFVEAVYRRNGASGLRALAGLPNETPALLAAMRVHLGLSSTDADALEQWWREAAQERSSRDSPG